MPSSRTPLIRVLGALGVVLALGLGFVLARPDLMLVEHVVFEGNQRATPAALRHLVDVRNGTTVWGVDADRAAHGAETHPWVRSASARVRLPDTVVVRVEEYQPAAMLLRHGELYYVDRSGVAFLRARSDDLDHPVLTGVDDALEQAHPDLPRLVVRDALWLLDALDSRGLVSRSQVSELAFSATRGFTAHLSSGAEVRFGLERLEQQTDRLAALLHQGVDLGRPLLVDLAPATVAIVRPLIDAGGEG